ncbi:MAG: sigma-70 family RNA polymerase sigma factor [Chloroflexota bacterium]|nr:sigma-70 family RNA polymerase sigma factor [Chloroflexota bacterium]
MLSGDARQTGRTNQEWLAELRGPKREQALSDLRSLLVHGLRYALAGRSGVTEADMEDFAQDALLKILAGLDSFRGESRFTTWAHKIAIRVAFTELRRRRWRDVPLDEMIGSDTNFIPETLVDPAAGPEQQAIQRAVLNVLRQTIAEDLTDKQRQALVATGIHGLPVTEVARRMNTNRNALYKLLHDARRRLQKRMIAKGLSPQDVLAAFEQQAGVRE